MEELVEAGAKRKSTICTRRKTAVLNAPYILSDIRTKIWPFNVITWSLLVAMLTKAKGSIYFQVCWSSINRRQQGHKSSSECGDSLSQCTEI